MLRGPSKDNQVVGFRIDVHAHVRRAGQQRLQHLQGHLRIGIVNPISFDLNRPFPGACASRVLRLFDAGRGTSSCERRPIHPIGSASESAAETAAEGRGGYAAGLSFPAARTPARQLVVRAGPMLVECSGQFGQRDFSVAVAICQQ